jgi:acetolactate decarboxylase
VNPPEPGTRLVDAAKVQSEFVFSDIDGTLVGLWSPGFSSAFSISGYHFHFLSKDRQHGGHLLDVEAGPLSLKVEALTDFHLALPESEAFLGSKEPSAAYQPRDPGCRTERKSTEERLAVSLILMRFS